MSVNDTLNALFGTAPDRPRVTIEEAQIRDPGPSRCPWCKQDVGTPHSSTCPKARVNES